MIKPLTGKSPGAILKTITALSVLGLLISVSSAGAASAAPPVLSPSATLDRYLEDPPDRFKPPLPTLNHGVPRFQQTVRDQLLVIQFMRALKSDPVYYHTSMDLIRINQQRLIIRQLARLLERADPSTRTAAKSVCKNHRGDHLASPASLSGQQKENGSALKPVSSPRHGM